MSEHHKILDAPRISRTIGKLVRRIEERFGQSGLLNVARELEQLSIKATDQVDEIAKPNLWWRALVATVLLVLTIVFVVAVSAVIQRVKLEGQVSLLDLLGALEAATNELVFIGLALIFIVNIERRYKRKRALNAMHELRSIAHVIDMHQLTKDPSVYSASLSGTLSSPKRSLTLAELMRYLNYCSELLSLTGKVAALYIQRFDDEVTLASAGEVENLVTGLCQKIWQKIVIAEELSERLGNDHKVSIILPREKDEIVQIDA